MSGNRRRVLIVQPISPAALALLDARPDVTYEVLADASPATIAAGIGDAEAVIIRDAPLPGEVLQHADRLRIIARHGVGTDNLPVQACSDRGIAVAIIGQVNTDAVAEHTLYLLLAVAKRGPRFDRAIRDGDFAIRGRHTTLELAGRTLLLVGYGRIGQEVARRARAFGMNIAVHDPACREAPEATLHADLASALSAADVVSLHLPLTPATRNLIDGAALARMRPGAILINAARGGIVDEAALIAALQAGHLFGAGLDTFAREPLPADDPLLARDDIVLSPHNAALTADSLVAMGVATVRNVLAAFDGTLDRTLVVNPQVLPAA